MITVDVYKRQAQHPDFAGRILAFKDFTGQEREAYDDSGHGTHVAGILAGSGCRSQGNYAGMAPKAGLLIGKVLDKEGNGAVRTILDGIESVSYTHLAFERDEYFHGRVPSVHYNMY